MTDTLKPCPFCGETAKLWADGKVSCSNPGCGCWRSHLQDNATPFWPSDWNTRTPAPAPQEAMGGEECPAGVPDDYDKGYFEGFRDAANASLKVATEKGIDPRQACEAIGLFLSQKLKEATQNKIGVNITWDDTKHLIECSKTISAALSSQAPDPQEPTEEELAAVVRAAWLKVKPSNEAQHIRAEISTLFDTGKWEHTSEADFMPLYVWDIADIAAQTAINGQAPAAIYGGTSDNHVFRGPSETAIARLGDLNTALELSTASRPAAMREGDLEVLKSEACEATGYQYSGTRKAVYATINYLHKRGLLRVGEG